MERAEPLSPITSDAWMKRPTRRLPKIAVQVLQQWYSMHSEHPYPTNEERGRLEAQTGLTTSQILNWFANARRRQKGNNEHVSQDSITIPNSVSLPDLHSSPYWNDVDPLTRWRNSPPEQEHVSLSTISKAIDTDPMHRVTGDCSEQASISPLVPPFPVRRAASEASFGSWNALSSSGASSESISTSTSDGSSGSLQIPRFRLAHRRRHRRLPTHPRASNAVRTRLSSPGGSKRLYQCTFCTDTFRTKYDWTRHEGSLHLSLEKWICLQSGPTYKDPSERHCCVFCNEPEPTEVHLSLHHYQQCSDKSLLARTFFRKDHFRQHIRLVHGTEHLSPPMYRWKAKTRRVNCRCGFCEQLFQNWDERNEHLAQHFREGANIKDWKGCRGLDPLVALHVRNAMPPYLIGVESHEFEPFSATRNCQSNTEFQTQYPPPTRFEDLTGQLAAYVRSAVASGITVTDETVRKKARLFLFGDDDAWNQTPADNEEWLRLFKKGLDLGNSQSSSHAQTRNNISTDLEQEIHSQSISFMAPPQATLIADPDDFFACHNMLAPNAAQQMSFCNPLEAEGAGIIPLAWQTPECLAEFRDLCIASGNCNVPVSDRTFQCTASDSCARDNTVNRAIPAREDSENNWDPATFDAEFSLDDMLLM